MFPDFVEFVASLNENRVRYLIVGGYAVAVHDRPRATKDLDVWIEPTSANAQRVMKALDHFFGHIPPNITVSKLINPRTVLVLGVPPIRIDLLTQIDGPPSFVAAWKRKIITPMGNAKMLVLSRQDLVAAKLAAGRPQDLLDAANLTNPKRWKKRST